ncbi:MAG: hypothetical protein QXI07_10855 [Pyrobaculum sp.]
MRDDLGPSLVVLGAATAALGLLQPNLAPLVALGLAAVAVGLLATWEPRAREVIVAKLSEAGWENVSALIQAMGLPPKAYYLPSTAAGRPVAVLAASPPEKVARDALIFKTGGSPALVLSTPGTKALEICRDLPEDLGEALRSCLVNNLGLARSVAVAQRGGEYVVEYRGASAPPIYEKLLARSALGSAIASITAAVAAEVLNRPVEIISEKRDGKTHVVVLR